MTFKAILNRTLHHAPRHQWVKPGARNELFYIKAKAEARNKRDGRALFTLG